MAEIGGLDSVFARASFAGAFRRSRKGNLWTDWRGMSLTVFRRPCGRYAWSASDEAGPTFSATDYGTEAEALDALRDAVRDL